MENCSIPVPCNRCPNCVARRVSGWSFRLIQEDKMSKTSSFITLTYDTQHVPLTRNGFMSLEKRHLQLFFKRLRKRDKKSHIKYYAVGEYGGKTLRPHYHIIIFNAKISDIQEVWVSYDDEGKPSPTGSIHYGTVSGASVGYTLKYMSKKSRIPLHVNDDRIPEFSLMSKGLGSGYLTEEIISWHKNKKLLDKRMYLTLPGGKKASMPRYYKEKIYNEQERKRIAYFAAIKYREEEIQKEKMDTAETLRARIEGHKAQFQRMHYKSDNKTII